MHKKECYTSSAFEICDLKLKDWLRLECTATKMHTPQTNSNHNSNNKVEGSLRDDTFCRAGESYHTVVPKRFQVVLEMSNGNNFNMLKNFWKLPSQSLQSLACTSSATFGGRAKADPMAKATRCGFQAQVVLSMRLQRSFWHGLHFFRVTIESPSNDVRVQFNAKADFQFMSIRQTGFCSIHGVS